MHEFNRKGSCHDIKVSWLCLGVGGRKLNLNFKLEKELSLELDNILDEGRSERGC